MSIINQIRAALDTHISSISGLPTVVNQNLKYTPSEDTPFITTALVPATIRPAVMGLYPQQRYQGIYQLLICTPQGNGAGLGYGYADTILQHINVSDDISFSPSSDLLLMQSGDTLLLESGDALLLDNTIFVTVAYAEVGASYLDTPFYCTPVTISWFTYH